MVTDGSGERKVRGSRIRSSRDEKRGRPAVPDERTLPGDPGGSGSAGTGSAGSPGGDAGGTGGGADAFAPDTGPFVETPAVEAVRERVERWLDVGRPVHLIGPTGCGKTSLAVATARERDRPVVFVNGDADLSTADLVGEYAGQERYSVRDNYVHNVRKSKDVVRDRWVDNPLTVAAREGATLVYNEFARTKPEANNVLLSVFEEGVLELPGRRGEDRYVEVHPEFRAILTSNSAEYAGVHRPQDALLDRLIGVHLDFYDAETEVEIVTARTGIDRSVARGVVAVVRGLRESVEVTVGTRAAVVAAEGLTAFEDPTDEDLAAVVTDAVSSKVPDAEALAELRKTVGSVVASELGDGRLGAGATDGDGPGEEDGANDAPEPDV